MNLTDFWFFKKINSDQFLNAFSASLEMKTSIVPLKPFLNKNAEIAITLLEWPKPLEQANAAIFLPIDAKIVFIFS